MCILMKRDMCTRLFLLCQIRRFMCNYKSFNIEDLKDLKDQKLSVNQTAAQIKLTEAWKASRGEGYPVKIRRDRGAENEQRRFKLNYFVYIFDDVFYYLLTLQMT